MLTSIHVILLRNIYGLMHIPTGIIFIGFVPGPMIFGAIIDSTCLRWQTTIRSTSTSDHGACVLYDVDQFRVKVHVLTLLFKIGAVMCVIVLYVVVVRWQRKKVINRTDRVPDQQETMLFDISTQDNNDSTSNRTPEVLQ